MSSGGGPLTLLCSIFFQEGCLFIASKCLLFGSWWPTIEAQKSLFYPVEGPEVIRMDSSKTEDVPDHFSTKKVHVKS